jgi:hypothetical protein
MLTHCLLLDAVLEALNGLQKNYVKKRGEGGDLPWFYARALGSVYKNVKAITHCAFFGCSLVFLCFVICLLFKYINIKSCFYSNNADNKTVET